MTESDAVGLIDSVARPLLRVALPSAVDPLKKVTVPVAVEGETVAVKVTVWPEIEGFRLEARLVVVFVFVVPAQPPEAAEFTAFEAFNLPQP